MTQKLIIGLTGLKQSGKTTAGKMLAEELQGMEVSFAEPIRKFISENFGYKEETKEDPIGFLDHCPITDNYNRHGARYPDQITPRYLMQTLGTEWGRDMIHPELWVLLLHRRLDMLAAHRPLSVFIVSDLRFDNEAKYIRSMGGEIVLMTNPEAKFIDSHVSEEGIRSSHITQHIENDWKNDDAGKSALREKVKALAHKLRTKAGLTLPLMPAAPQASPAQATRHVGERA